MQFNEYECGWWRAYDNADDASLLNRAWDDIGVSPNDDGSFPGPLWKKSAIAALQNGWDDRDGGYNVDLSLHTFKDVGPDYYFTGVTFPWICRTDDLVPNLPAQMFTDDWAWNMDGTPGVQCYVRGKKHVACV